MHYPFYSCLLALLLCSATAQAQIFTLSDTSLSWKQYVEAQFELFKVKHNKVYESQSEQLKRKAIFQKNLAYIEAHNSDINATFHLQVNKFSDLTSQEFSSLYGSRRDTTKNAMEVDWSSFLSDAIGQGVPMRQSYAFCTVDAIQAVILRNFGQELNLSTKELMDCVLNLSQEECTGQCLNDTYSYIEGNGISLFSDYEQTIKQESRCGNKVGDIKIDGFKNVGRGEMVKQLEITPLSAIIASHHLQSYTPGSVLTCNTTANASAGLSLQAVLIVAYSESQNAFKIKNYEGNSWGQSGYAWVTNQYQYCFIVQHVYAPLIL